MRKYLIITLVTVFLLSSCTSNNIKTTMENIESNNKLLQQQLDALEKENEALKNQNSILIEEVKKKDLEIEKLTQEIKLIQKGKSFDNENIKRTKVIDADLNDDGNIDIIKLECTDTKYYRLNINDVTITSIGMNVDLDKFQVVDINVDDNIKEIAISEWGVDKTPKTHFYRYCIDNISSIGKINGYIDDIIFHKDGSLTTYANGNILCSWTYKERYKLSPYHILTKESKDLYEINIKTKVLKSIPLVKSTTENDMIAALTVGEEVTLLASDNKRWCQVEKENGVKGWFEVEDFDKIKGTGYTVKDVFKDLK